MPAGSVSGVVRLYRGVTTAGAAKGAVVGGEVVVQGNPGNVTYLQKPLGNLAAGNTTAKVAWFGAPNSYGVPITGYVITPYIGAVAQTPQTFNSTATTQSATPLLARLKTCATGVGPPTA